MLCAFFVFQCGAFLAGGSVFIVRTVSAVFCAFLCQIPVDPKPAGVFETIKRIPDSEKRFIDVSANRPANNIVLSQRQIRNNRSVLC